MKKMATLVILALALAATSASALDMQKRTPLVQPQSVTAPNAVNTVLGCDDGAASNAYYQGTDDRFGNLFSFGGGAVLSAVGFYHYGYGFSGPYSFDLEVWDPASCTVVATVNNLVASDAGGAPVFDVFDTCPNQLYLAGDLMVGIDPNSCLAANDCYPDLMFDDQLDVVCPVIINNASTSPACYDVSSQSGPFILRIDTNNCAVPTRKGSWGQLKSSYR